MLSSICLKKFFENKVHAHVKRIPFSCFLFLIAFTFLGPESLYSESVDQELSLQEKRELRRAERVARRKARQACRRNPCVKSISLLSAETGRAIRGMRVFRTDRTLSFRKIDAPCVLIHPRVVQRRTKSTNVFINGELLPEAPHPKAGRFRWVPEHLPKWCIDKENNDIELQPFSGREGSGIQGPAFRISITFDDFLSKASADRSPSRIAAPDLTEEMTNAEQVQKSRKTQESSKSSAAWELRNSVIHKDGRPFFPFGIYYTSFFDHQKRRRLEDLSLIAASGLNMIHTPVDLQDEALMDEAQKQGLDVILEFNANPDEIIKKFGRHPALAWLGTHDDVDSKDSSGRQKYSPREVELTADYLKSQLPSALTYASGGWPKEISDYLGKTEILASQSYPVPFEKVSALASDYYRELASTAQRRGKRFIANLQTFAWDGGRIPTRQELRNMTYQSLILGVNGIIFYTFFDEGNDLRKHPKILSELSLLSEEMNELKDFVLLGDRTELSTGDSDLFAAQWTKGSTLLLLVVNGHASRSQSVSLQLGTRAQGPLQRVFSSRESGMRVRSGIVEGDLKPLAVHVYTLALGS